MAQRRSWTTLMVSLALVFSVIACSSSPQFPQIAPSATPTEVPPTNLPPTETLPPPATVIPTDSTATPVTTEDPPETGRLNIVEINSFMDESNYWYFYGLVRNDTSSTVSDIQIEIKLFDAAGGTIYSYTTYTMLNYLEPGETTPFSDFTTQAYVNGATVQATVIGSSTISSINRAIVEYRGVTIWADDYNDVYLAGEIVNNGSEPVKVNGIAGTLVDSTGKFVSAAAAYTFLGYLEPNSSGPFVMMFDAPIGQARSLTNSNLFSDVLITNPNSTYDLLLSESQIDYRDVNGDFHLVGSLTNNTTQPMIAYLIAGIYDGAGNCIDANYLYFSMPINSGDTIPYDFTLWGALDYVPEAYDAASNYRVIVDWSYTYEATVPAFVLGTEENTNNFEGGSGVFTGTVINNSGQDLSSAIVIISLKDRSSEVVIATGYSFVADTLLNNESGSYEVTVFPPTDIDLANVDIVITAFGQSP